MSEKPETTEISELFTIDLLSVMSEKFTHAKDFGDVVTNDWNAEGWLDLLEKAKAAKNINVMKMMRRLEYAHTYAIVKRGRFWLDDGTEHRIDELPVETVCCRDLPILPAVDNSAQQECCVRVLELDCFEAAKALVDRGMRPAVLNMASPSSPGGGVVHGAAAQEEYLHRASNYLLWSEKLRGPGIKSGYTGQEPLYPMTSDFSVYVTHNVTVFRAPESKGYALIEPFRVGVIACAAINTPTLVPDPGSSYDEQQSADAENPVLRMCSEDVRKTQLKLAAVLSAAHEQGFDSVVLGAFGCGAFKNPSRDVAAIMQSVVSAFRFHFRAIDIAIIEDHNSEDNLLYTFEDTFEYNTAVADVKPVAPARMFDCPANLGDWDAHLVKELYACPATEDPPVLVQRPPPASIVADKVCWLWENQGTWTLYPEEDQEKLECGVAEKQEKVYVGAKEERFVETSKPLENGAVAVPFPVGRGEYARFRIEVYKQCVAADPKRSRKVRRLVPCETAAPSDDRAAQWLWFDTATKTWSPYSEQVQAELEAARANGTATVGVDSEREVVMQSETFVPRGNNDPHAQCHSIEIYTQRRKNDHKRRSKIRRVVE